MSSCELFYREQGCSCGYAPEHRVILQDECDGDPYCVEQETGCGDGEAATSLTLPIIGSTEDFTSQKDSFVTDYQAEIVSMAAAFIIAGLLRRR